MGIGGTDGHETLGTFEQPHGLQEPLGRSPAGYREAARWFRGRRLFVSVRPDVVTVFPLTLSDDVVLVKQYKHAIQQITVELPAGTFSDESPEQAARRELLEETGYQCGAMKVLGQAYENASRNTNTIHMFLATGCVLTPARNLQDLEASAGIDVMTIPRSELLLQIRAGKIKELSSVATILRALDALAQ